MNKKVAKNGQAGEIEICINIVNSQQIGFSTPWLPCAELSRELRLPCLCSVQQYGTTALHMNCDKVVFIGTDIPSLPFGAPIVSFSQRHAGRQILPSQLFLSSGLPLSKVDFSGNSLRRFSERHFSNIQATLTELRLSDNLLGDSLNPIFSTPELHGLQYLKILDLSRNQIKSIEEGILKGCDRLEEFYLDGNNLRNVPSESLNGPKKLKLLSLKNNRLDAIKSSSFHLQEFLEIIDLSSNQISLIEHSTFSGLTNLLELNLSNNQLSKVNSDSFEGAINLNRLDLSNNYFNQVPASSFKSFSNLTLLNISANLIQNIQHENLLGLENLEVLDLSRNKIENLEGKMFGKLNRLKYLDLSINSLRSIDDNAFDGLISLETLKLCDNNILLLPSVALASLPLLTHLHLDFNRITAINNDILRSVSGYLKEFTLSHNIIREIPLGTFYQMNNLKILDLSSNLISTFDLRSYFGLEEKLEELNLSNNRIETIMNSTQYLKKFKSLNLSSNKLTYISENLFATMPNIQSLDLSNNKQLNMHGNKALENLKQIYVHGTNIKKLSNGAFNLNKNLEIIDLSNNKLEEINEQTFTNINNLTKIDLSNNQITNIRASSFVNVMNIRELNLSRNSLAAFKGEIFNTGTSLEILDLSSNQLSYLFPSSFKIHPRLKVLICNNNKFNYFPAELISSLQFIQTVDLSYNELKTIDELDFARLPRLRELKVANNYLESISEMAFHNSTQLQVLDLSYNKLERMGERTFEGLARLEYLNLEKNSLSELPENIFDRAKLYMLERINLADNQFSIAPLRSLQKQYFFLSSVDLSRNQLVDIPPDDSIMVNIKQLDISFNPLSAESIKNILGEPKTVRHLNMAGTGISYLPEMETPFLQMLNVSYNNISELREKSFERTTLLQVLDISSNQLPNLKKSIWSKLKNLLVLNVSNNPIEIIQNGDLDELNDLTVLDISSLHQCLRIEKIALQNLKKLRTLQAFDYPKLGYLDIQGIFQQLNKLEDVNIEIKDSTIGQEQLEPILHPQLKRLTLYGKRLQQISNGALAGLKASKISLKLVNTSIQSIPAQLFFSLPKSSEIDLDISGSELTVLSKQFLQQDDRNLHISGFETNPIVCDCNAKALKKFIGHLTVVKCTKPDFLKGKNLLEINDTDLVCDSKRTTATNEQPNKSNLVTKSQQQQQTTKFVYDNTEPDIIWSVAPTKRPKVTTIATPVIVSQIHNDDTIVISIVGGVVAFIIILMITICIIRLRMSTIYSGGPMVGPAVMDPTLGASQLAHFSSANSNCACSVVGKSNNSVYSVPGVYAASTLPHRYLAPPNRIPVYATMGSRSSLYSYQQQQQVGQPYFMMLPPNTDEKIYR